MGQTFTTEIQAHYRDINLAGHVDNVEAVRVLDEASYEFLRFAFLPGLPAGATGLLHGTDPEAVPAPVGFEVAGVLSAIGAGTEIASGPAEVGDAVLAFRVSGGYASALTVPAKDVFAKPDNLDFAEAANLLLAGTTAAEMLDVVHAQGGETILLHGASGAVGVRFPPPMIGSESRAARV